MQLRRLRAAVVVLFVLSLVGLFVVEPDEPGGVFVTAAAATEKAGTAAFSIDLTIGVIAAPSTTRGEGRLDFERNRGVVTMATPRAEVVFHDGVAYSRNEGQPMWLAIDIATYDRNVPAAGLTQGDPLAAFDAMRRAGVARNVREEPGDDVRGVPTVRYSAELDADQFARNDGERATIRSLDLQTIDYAIWVDDAGRVRRLRSALQSSAIAVELTIELFDFGIEVVVEPPPPDQVQRMGKG